ncbi:hypothetical protein H1C71_035181 [Ictidomys tridecemlineatus]|nr:hypothetical protein H1C71_035181 [Ictidomys tridecemlineatus]
MECAYHYGFCTLQTSGVTCRWAQVKPVFRNPFSFLYNDGFPCVSLMATVFSPPETGPSTHWLLPRSELEELRPPLDSQKESVCVCVWGACVVKGSRNPLWRLISC